MFRHNTVKKTSDAPYPPSHVITNITWDNDVLKLKEGSGDNWPITWVDDDLQITSYGDGRGFSEREPRMTLGFARIYCNPPNHYAEDLFSDADTVAGFGPKGIKSSGVLMVDGILYLFVRNYTPSGTEDYTNSRLAWSTDRGVHWTWVEWYFADTFGCPEFVQFGQNYHGARDHYVYIVSQGNDNAYEFSPNIVLARVPKKEVTERNHYEFFTGLESMGEPTWSSDIAKRKPILTDLNGVQRISLTYNAGLQRYILTKSHVPPNSPPRPYTPALGIFDAPEPWGPWTTVYYNHHWSNDFRTYHHKFPTKWMSEDGTTMWLLFSGLDGGFYDFCLQKVTLAISR